MPPRMNGEAVSQAKKLAEQAAKIITLPVNTREVSNCPYPRRTGLPLCSERLGTLRRNKVGNNSNNDTTSNTPKIACQPK